MNDWLCDCKKSSIRWIDELQPHPAISRSGWFCGGCLREFAPLNKLDALKGALESADECLSLIEDVGHGAMSENVTVARKIVLDAISLNTSK